jgi:hypothetical protein
MKWCTLLLILVALQLAQAIKVEKAWFKLTVTGGADTEEYKVELAGQLK